MATLSAQSLSSLELGPKCANLHLVLISFWALTTGSIFSNQTLEIQQRLQILGFGRLVALKVLQIPGFGGLIALKVLQIPGFGRLLALKVLQIPGFGGLLALKTLQNSRISISQILEFKGLFCTKLLRPKCANLHLVLISFWALTTGSIFSTKHWKFNKGCKCQDLGVSLH